MLCAYALIVLQSDFKSLDMYAPTACRPACTVHYLDLSHVLYNSTGCAFALAMGCSLSCTLRVYGCCLPDKLPARALRAQAGQFRNRARVFNTVFIVTYIKSSSTWRAMGDAKVVQRVVHYTTSRGGCCGAVPRLRDYDDRQLVCCWRSTRSARPTASTCSSSFTPRRGHRISTASWPRPRNTA